MSEPLELGSWAIAYTNGGKYYVADEHWQELVSAYHGWMERSHNRVLTLTGRDGAQIVIAASVLTDICRSTPETRMRMAAIEQAEKAERGFQE